MGANACEAAPRQTAFTLKSKSFATRRCAQSLCALGISQNYLVVTSNYPNYPKTKDPERKAGDKAHEH